MSSASILKITRFKPLKPIIPAECVAVQISYLDELIVDDAGRRMFICSDTDYCETRQAAGHKGKDAA